MIERIVSNTSPLLALTKMRTLDAVGKLPYQFICPAEVETEIRDGAKQGYQIEIPAFDLLCRTFGCKFSRADGDTQIAGDDSQPAGGRLQFTGEHSRHTDKHSYTTNDYSPTRDDGSRLTNTNSRITDNNSQVNGSHSLAADDDSHAADAGSLIENNRTQENFEKWKLVNREN